MTDPETSNRTPTVTDQQRLTATGPAENVDDPTIEALAAELEPDEDEERGGGEAAAAPFDLGIPRPRAIDLRKLWKLSGQTPDKAILAALGPNRPILLAHAVTAFPVGAGRPPRVWGIRYRSSVFGVDADTVDLQPNTELLDIVQVDSQAELGLSLGGKLSVLGAATGGLSALPGVDLNGASVSADTDQKATLRIRFTMSVPKVIAGPDAAGGAGWQLYAQDRRLEGHQALLQTLLVPKGADRLRIEVVSSVAAAGWFGPRQWTFETASFDVPLGGGR
jgi:hypothetical protein